MNSFERQIVGAPPLAEAAAFFVKLKTAASDPQMGAAPAPEIPGGDVITNQPPPEEDQQGGLLGLYTAVVVDEFKSMLAYHIYAQSLRDLSHDAIAEHFDAHAEEEAEHADFVMQRMAVLGGGVQVPPIEPPPASTNPVEIVKTLLGIEEEGLAAWQALHDALPETDPTRFKVEEYMSVEQEHKDDLTQLLPHEEAAAAAPIADPTNASAIKPPAEAGPEAQSASAPIAPVSVKVGSAKTAVSLQYVADKVRTGASGATKERLTEALKKSLSGPQKPPFSNAKRAVERYHLKKELLHRTKTSSAKHAFLEKLQPGTEHYYSDRMLEALNQMPAKVYTAPIGLDGEKTAAPEGIGQLISTTLKKKPPLPQGAPIKIVGGLTKGKIASMRAKLADLSQNTPGDVPPQQMQQPVAAGGGGASAGYEGAPDISGYLANETAGRQAEEAGSVAYYQQKFQEAAGQLKGMQEQTQGLQAQLEQTNTQIQQSMQSTQAAQSTATQALQQSVSAADDALKQRQMASQMRQGYQQLRGQMTDLAAQDPMAQVGSELNGSAAQAAQVPGVGPDGQPAAAQQAQPGQAGETQTPQSGDQAPTSGPAAEQQGPAAKAQGGANAPGAAPPEGETEAKNTANSSGPQGADRSTGKGTTAVSIKTSSIAERLPYAAGGALLGAGFGAADATMGNEGLKEKVEKLESQEGGFGKAMDAAQAKFRLALSEAAHKYPAGAVATGALGGGVLGFAGAPAIKKSLKSLGTSAKRISG